MFHVKRRPSFIKPKGLLIIKGRIDVAFIDARSRPW